MERRIGNRRYNTDTATELASWDEDGGRCVRVLSRKDAALFLHVRETGHERIESVTDFTFTQKETGSLLCTFNVNTVFGTVAGEVEMYA